jgi:cyclohexadienyl dehydratase
VLPVPDNAAVVLRLRRDEADAVVTDTWEAPHWEARLPGVVRLGPFTRDRKAYLLPPAADDLAAELDAWLLAREADGTLARLRAAALDAQTSPTATALGALVAAVDERLALMPWVADAKRAIGAPVHVPAREARVVEAALAATRRAARDAGRGAPPDAAVEAFFRAQFGAARALQQARLAEPAPAEPPPDLDGALRPALLRIGARIAGLLVLLPEDAEPRAVRDAVRRGLATPGLAEADREAIAEALAALAVAPRRAEPEVAREPTPAP